MLKSFQTGPIFTFKFGEFSGTTWWQCHAFNYPASIRSNINTLIETLAPLEKRAQWLVEAGGVTEKFAGKLKEEGEHR
jgi:hypothetical protein